MDLRKIFKLCDRDASSFVGLTEMVEFVTKVMDVSSEIAESVMESFQESDENNDGQLDFPEFLKLMRRVTDEGVKLPDEDQFDGELTYPDRQNKSLFDSKRISLAFN